MSKQTKKKAIATLKSKSSGEVKKMTSPKTAPAQKPKQTAAPAPAKKAAGAKGGTFPVHIGGKMGRVVTTKGEAKSSTAVKAPASGAPEWATKEIKPKLCKAVPKKMEDGKPVSNYRGVRLAIIDGGPEAGMAHGLALGLPATQVRAYVKELLALLAKPKTDKKPASAPKEKGSKNGTSASVAPKSAVEFEPHFNYDSREKAQKAAIGAARRAGMAEANFHVISEKGKFAIAPIHYKPKGEPPVFEVGDVVMDTIIKDSRAVVVEAGPQQSVVKYDDPKRGKQAIPNYYLYKIGTAKTKKTAAAPKGKSAKKG